MSETEIEYQLIWQPPDSPGAVTAFYDTLRSESAWDFEGSTVCLEADETDTTSTDDSLPAAGSAFHYLIRVENDCPGDPGAMGTDSAGDPRTGVACP